MRRLRPIILVCLVAFTRGAAADQAPPAPDGGDAARIRELQRRVEALEAAATAKPPPVLAPAPAEKPKPLDEREPPFGDLDWSWMNGSNGQPSSLLGMGPITWSIYIDTYYAFQFHQPVDHTIFPSTVAPRHNELSINLSHLGVEITGLDGPIGRLYIQYGSNAETTVGQDPTTARGFFLTQGVFKYVQQAAAGWHFHALHGINLELGIFSSYVGLESYLPQENWAYTHAFVSDATPYYFFGLRAQLFVTQHSKIELWVVNGWQTFGQWHEGRAGGYLWNWRPREWLSIVNSLYAGQEVRGDPDSLRLYSDNNVQLRYYKGRGGGPLKSAAFSLTGDIGWEHRGAGAPDGPMGGFAFTHRFQWTDQLGTSLRFDLFYDRTRALTPSLPLGASSIYKLPEAKDPFLGYGASVTLDYLPRPWMLFRLEYAHREANVPIFSGPGGITGPGGVAAADPTTFTPDLVTSDDRLVVNATLRL